VGQLRGEIASADRVLKVLEAMVKERGGKPGGTPLKR
jgi:hypothetical protein